MSAFNKYLHAPQADEWRIWNLVTVPYTRLQLITATTVIVNCVLIAWSFVVFLTNVSDDDNHEARQEAKILAWLAGCDAFLALLIDVGDPAFDKWVWQSPQHRNRWARHWMSICSLVACVLHGVYQLSLGVLDFGGDNPEQFRRLSGLIAWCLSFFIALMVWSGHWCFLRSFCYEGYQIMESLMIWTFLLFSAIHSWFFFTISCIYYFLWLMSRIRHMYNAKYSSEHLTVHKVSELPGGVVEIQVDLENTREQYLSWLHYTDHAPNENNDLTMHLHHYQLSLPDVDKDQSQILGKCLPNFFIRSWHPMTVSRVEQLSNGSRRLWFHVRPIGNWSEVVRQMAVCSQREIQLYAEKNNKEEETKDVSSNDQTRRRKRNENEISIETNNHPDHEDEIEKQGPFIPVVLLDGPFPSLSLPLRIEQYRCVLFLSGGFGVACLQELYNRWSRAMLSVRSNTTTEQDSNDPIEVYGRYIHAIPEQRILMESLEGQVSVRQIKYAHLQPNLIDWSTNQSLSSGGANIGVELHITSRDLLRSRVDRAKLLSEDVVDSNMIVPDTCRLVPQRDFLDIEREIEKLVGLTSSMNLPRAALIVCGPREMRASVRRAVKEYQNSAFSLDLHIETSDGSPSTTSIVIERSLPINIPRAIIPWKRRRASLNVNWRSTSSRSESLNEKREQKQERSLSTCGRYKHFDFAQQKTTTTPTSPIWATKHLYNRDRFGVIFRCKNRYLCVQQALDPWYVGFVKGAIEDVDHGDGYACAVREVYEEIGIHLDKNHLKVNSLPIACFPDRNLYDRSYMFYLYDVKEEFVCAIDHYEIAMYKWMTLRDLSQWAKASFTAMIIPRLIELERLTPYNHNKSSNVIDAIPSPRRLERWKCTRQIRYT